jgi:hypothetical protein
MTQLVSHQRLRCPLVPGICLTCLLALMGSGDQANAQGNTYLNQAAKRLSKRIDKANSEVYVLVSNQLSFGGGWLKQSKEWTSLFTITLEAGKDYRFVVEGDDDARDIDLQLMDPAGKVVAIDVRLPPTSEVNYRPAKTLPYVVRVRLYASRNNLPCMVLATALVKK